MWSLGAREPGLVGEEWGKGRKLGRDERDLIKFENKIFKQATLQQGRDVLRRKCASCPQKEASGGWCPGTRSSQLEDLKP